MQTTPIGVLNFFKCLASESPVCSYVLPDPDIIDIVRNLTNVKIKMDVHTMQLLQENLPVFFNLMKDVATPSLPDDWQPLVTRLADIAAVPFQNAPKSPQGPPPPEESELCW